MTRALSAAAALGGFGLLAATASAASCCGGGAHATHAGATHASTHGAVSNEILEPYLAIQQALAADSMEGVSKHAAKLADVAELGAAGKLADAEDIETARHAFHSVSKEIVKRAQAAGMENTEVRLAHCPMAFGNEGADWLQTGDTLANPYYGAAMLRCGEFREHTGAAQGGRGERGGHQR